MVQVASIVSVLVIPVLAGRFGAGANAIHAMGWFLVVGTPITLLTAVLTTPETVNPDHRHTAPRLADYFSVLRKPDLLRLYAAQFAMTLGPGRSEERRVGKEWRSRWAP